jgi:predicted DNA-binding transcriptional regulator AlpA
MQNSPAPEVPADILTEKELAQSYKHSVSLARKWRRTGEGPPFIRLGGKLIRYRRADVEAWLTGQRREPSAKASPVLQK